MGIVKKDENKRKCPNCGGYMHGVWSISNPDEIVFHCIDCNRTEAKE